MRALPERQRQHSVLPLLHFYNEPDKPGRGALAATERFRAAVQEAKIGPTKTFHTSRTTSSSSTSPTCNCSDCCSGWPKGAG
jgi:thioester reductase-like protein